VVLPYQDPSNIVNNRVEDLLARSPCKARPD
jgi:hypothetical protein